MNYHLATSMKDEGPFLLEWIAHHKVVGFNRILVGFNDCSDGSDELLRLLANHGEIEVIENFVPVGKNPQRQFHAKLFRTDFYNTANWLGLIDLDEFVNIHYGNGEIGQLLERYHDVDLLAFCWKNFGSNNYDFWRDGSITDRFTNCQRGVTGDNYMVKFIVRKPRRFAAITNHFARKIKPTGVITYANAAGRRFEHDERVEYLNMDVFEKFKNGNASHKEFQLNHYVTKTIDSFYLRRLRGRGFRIKGTTGQVRHHFKASMRFNRPKNETDISINRYKEARDSEIKKLKKLSGVGEIHDQITRRYEQSCKKARDIINAHIDGGNDLQDLFLNPIW